MAKRIDTLTAEQEAQMSPHADRWIDIGLCTDEANFEAWEVHARRCYAAAGIPWPGVVVRVQSPLVMALAAPMAAVLVELIQKRNGAVGDAVGDAVRGAVDGAVRDAVGGAVGDAVRGAVRGAVDGAVGGAVGDAVRGAVRGAVDGAVGGAVDGAVGDAVRGAVGGAVGDAVDGAVGGAVGDAVRDAVGDAVDGAVGDAVDGAVGDAVRDAVGDAVDGAVGDAVDGAVRGAVGDAVRGAVRGAVDGAVDGAVGDAVRDAVGGAVDGAVGDAVDGAVRGAVDGAVRGAVRGAVGGAVGDAVRDAELVRGLRRAISSSWYRSVRPYWSYWAAWTSYFRDVAGLELPGDLWDRGRAFEGTLETAYSWWPHRHFVFVCDRPTEIHREQINPRGWRSHRLHNETGPAVAWRDGWNVWAIHGVRVTEQIVLRPDTITVDDIWAETNAEVRRVMIDRIGWDRFIELADLKLVDEQPDPANPGNSIALYDLPEQVYDEPVRVVLVTNASPERDGTRRRFGITVPADHDDAVAAMAWTFQLDRATYADLARAT